MNSQVPLTAPRLLNKQQQEEKDQLLDVGNDAFDAGNLQAAFESYHKASLLDPGDPEVWNLLGLTYAALDYPQEAWRSYRLALLADGENLNALWYSAEFLYNQEDLELGRILLHRYLQLEDDPERRDEAEQLMAELEHLLEDEEQDHVPGLDDEEADEDDAELPDGFQTETEDGVETEIEDDELDEELEEEAEELDFGRFVAAVSLRLGDMSSKCPHCLAALPADAPYCYACHAPCFYVEAAAES